MATHDISFKDVNWGVLAQTLNIATGIILLPVILVYLSTEEVGLWFVFSTLASLAFLLELGLQPTIARYVSYLYAGAQKLEKVGISTCDTSASMNINLFSDVFFSSKIIYFRISVAAMILLMGLGSFYISTLLTIDLNSVEVLIAWLMFSAGFIANFYFGYYVSFLHGRGDITVANKVVVINRVLMIGFGSLFVFMGYGLLGLGLASLLSSFVSRFLLHRIFWNDQLAEIMYLKKVDKIIDKNTSGVLWHNSIKLGWVNLGAFLITRMNVLIASSFLGLSVAASYGLTMQVLIMLTALSSTLFTIKLPGMNANQISGDSEKIVASFGQSLFISWLFYLITVFSIILLGNYILESMGSNAMLLEGSLFVVFAIIMFLEMNHSICASFLTTYNEVSFVQSALVSGALIVLLSVLMITVFDIGLWGIVLSQGIVQLAYNNWKWPFVASEKVGMNFFNLLKLGLFKTYDLLQRSIRT